MIDWLNTIDTQVFLALNGLHAPYFDAFMKLFTGKWIWVPMYAAVLFAVVRNYRWRQTLAVLVCVALAITIADQVCATLIRPEVCRLRPSNPENPLSEMVHIVGGYRGGSYGFPSCHAANSFALASFLILLFANRKLSLFIFAWAVLNSYSRVYLGVHYPGDLLVGAIIGTAAGLAMAFAAGYVADRVDRPHLKPSVNTGVVTSVGAFTVAVIAVVSCFVRMQQNCCRNDIKMKCYECYLCTVAFTKAFFH